MLNEVTTRTYDFVSLIVKIFLSAKVTLSLSVLATQSTDQTQCFVHLSFSSTLQLINAISSDLQKLFRYFNGTAVVAFLKVPHSSSISVFLNNLALYLKDLKLTVFVISLLKPISSSLRNYLLWQNFELYSIKLYIGMAKSKSSASSIVVPSIFSIHLVNGPEF